MSTLRKACRNCTLYKRKCIVQLPKCIRCAQRGLECSYDLEPIITPTTQLQELPHFLFNPSNCDSPGYCIMKTLKFRPSFIDPTICRPGHRDAIEALRWGYLPVTGLLRAGKPAIFVHPKLQMHSDCDYLAALGEIGESGASHESFEVLLQLNVTKVPIKEALVALQALIVYLSTFVFPGSPGQQINAEKYLNVLSDWTRTLLASAKTRMPPDQSPWQEWLFGESVRRTILMSYILSLAISSFHAGHCTNWLFVESLPFDRRAGLWMAESPQAWIAAAKAKTGEEVGERLSSLHEFAEGLNRSEHTFYGDIFLALLAYGHNGGNTSKAVHKN
ncbi:uncharacterized protein LY89DRAFT_405987 [Mollisia scopiformis]|uniref:Zn(2)-C6 fungal-type domain-containing protein n=1 Tax=Mollisia scopiformis TaxID=149040 RepID=A0A132B3S7_MOLSC|nr:uncharacterized protein LY89DRAFT_405987 [Mollisia scopiformis]KUJ06574.1 hypothetical protein LY89DRAFT_405987 [Mollisia scopiformis]